MKMALMTPAGSHDSDGVAHATVDTSSRIFHSGSQILTPCLNVQTNHDAIGTSRRHIRVRDSNKITTDRARERDGERQAKEGNRGLE